MSWQNPQSPSPSGTIIPFYDGTGNVPKGWVVCDGNNGTFDMRDKFVVGTTTATENPGSTVGQNSITLSNSQLPSHTHGSSTGTTGSHNHKIGSSSNDDSYQGGATPSEIGFDGSGPLSTSGGGYHDHPNETSYDAGSDNSIDNRPQHTETLFIKKL